MADNVAITAGSGTNIATDDIGGVQYQRVKMTIGADGVSNGDVSSSNPLPVTASSALPVSVSNSPTVDGVGELIECLEAIRVRLGLLASSLAAHLPDTTGKLRVILATDSSINTITTVSTITNQNGLGGYNMQDQLAATLRMSADGLRRNITVT